MAGFSSTRGFDELGLDFEDACRPRKQGLCRRVEAKVYVPRLRLEKLCVPKGRGSRNRGGIVVEIAPAILREIDALNEVVCVDIRRYQ